MIPARDASELSWYFEGGAIDDHARDDFFGGSGGAVGESSFGAQLERARVLHRDSAGEVIPPSGRIAEVLRQQPDGTYLRAHELWPTMLVKPALVVPAAFLPSPGTVVEPTDAQTEAATARREKRLTRREAIEGRLGRLDHESYETVRLMYGPRGAQWLQTPRGRTWSLLPVTDAWRKQKLVGSDGDLLADLDLCTGFRLYADLTLGKQWTTEAQIAKERARRVEVSRQAARWLDAALNQAERRERRAAQAWARTAPRRPITITDSEDA